MYGHFIRFGFATKTIGEHGSPLQYYKHIATLFIYNKTPCHGGRVFYNYALRDRLNSLAVVAIVSIEVHLLDFLEERISWVCTCALVIKCLLCHSVKTV